MDTVLSWEEWFAHDATGLAGLVQSTDITASELAHQAARAIAALNPQIDGVIEVFDDALDDPEAAGTVLHGPFAGVPFLLKDLGQTMKGRLQEQGSRFMRGHIATEDSFLVSQMRRAGLNIIGRTTTPEFGCCSSAENPEVYVTKNPWDTRYTSCGSSAGSAVMVGAGVVPMAHGSDGGGSIRIPAGTCGAIGLKPSRGTFSIAPYGSDFTSVVSTQGCISRTVRDTAGFIDACRGGAPGEFMPFWSPPDPYTSLIAQDPAPLRIAVCDGWGPYKAAPHIAAELDRVATFIAGLGHHVEHKTPDVDFGRAFAAQTTCYITNFAQVVEGILQNAGLSTPPDDLIEPMNIRIWQAGKDASYAERARMQADFNVTARAFGAFYQNWDILLTPTTARETPLLGTRDYLTLCDTITAEEWFENLWGFFAFTPFENLCGTAGISLPLAHHRNGLPLGIQAHCGQGRDGLLLQLAAQIERAIDSKWCEGRLPEVHVTRIGQA